jgi:hypothetical protein
MDAVLDLTQAFFDDLPWPWGAVITGLLPPVAIGAFLAAVLAARKRRMRMATLLIVITGGAVVVASLWAVAVSRDLYGT